MAKELFDQTLVTEYAATDRIVLGVPGQTGCKNMLMDEFENQFGAATSGYSKGEFDDSDLVANVWTFQHDQNTEYVELILFNGSGIKEATDGIFYVVDVNTIAVDFGGAITGTWKYILKYFA